MGRVCYNDFRVVGRGGNTANQSAGHTNNLVLLANSMNRRAVGALLAAPGYGRVLGGSSAVSTGTLFANTINLIGYQVGDSPVVDPGVPGMLRSWPSR
jgi:hypothetical protein